MKAQPPDALLVNHDIVAVGYRGWTDRCGWIRLRCDERCEASGRTLWVARRWGPIRIDPGKVRMVTFALLFNRRTAAKAFDAFRAAGAGDPGGLALMSLVSDFVLPRLFTWGDFIAKGATADYEPSRDYHKDLDPPDAILGSPLSLLIFGGLAGGSWPVERIAADLRNVRPCAVETLLLSGTLDFSTPSRLATEELLPSLSKGTQIVVAEAGHVQDLWKLQPAATERLLTSFFDTGVADDSQYTYAPMDFAAGFGFPLIAKLTAAGAALLAAGFALGAWRFARRPRSSVH